MDPNITFDKPANFPEFVNVGGTPYKFSYYDIEAKKARYISLLVVQPPYYDLTSEEVQNRQR